MVNELRFHPILFSTPMVKAILDGRKTMTRRKFKPKDEPYLINGKSFINYSDSFGWNVKYKIQDNPGRFEITQTFKCPYGKIGDILWVRETWQYTDSSLNFQPGYVYKATDPDWETMEGWKWKPSIFMPKAACRIFLEITDIRVERLQDVSEEDAINEGVEFHKPVPGDGLICYKNYTSPKTPFYGDNAKLSFQTLWQSINGLESGEVNPFVWVVSFKQITKPINFK